MSVFVGKSLHHREQKNDKQIKSNKHPHLPMSRDTSDLKLDLSDFTSRHPKETLKIAQISGFQPPQKLRQVDSRLPGHSPTRSCPAQKTYCFKA